MAGYALAESVAAVARWNRRRRLDLWVVLIRERLSLMNGMPWRPGARISRFRRPTPDGNPPGAVVGPIIALAAACLAVVPPLVLPATTMSQIGVTVSDNQPSAWAEWNYSGYERKPDYPEYRSVIQMMAKVGADDGCGRTMWEYDPSLNRFGTTMSLMLLPYWTNGCVDSMEGLLFESASTTPFHFINQNELSVNPSDAVNSPDFTYAGLNLSLIHISSDWPPMRSTNCTGGRCTAASPPSPWWRWQWEDWPAPSASASPVWCKSARPLFPFSSSAPYWWWATTSSSSVAPSTTMSDSRLPGARSRFLSPTWPRPGGWPLSLIHI